ncbi:MAG: alpha/beta hydrolase [Candidatus Promineifilaceae bacterium]|jgi:pimeloyl-ACP methyl ester carboxylesterase
MSTFRRSMRWFFAIAGFSLGLATAISAYITRMMVAPTRQHLAATPQKKGLAFENVQFPAQDGLRVSGWFIPAVGANTRDGTTILLVHGWQWNRLGFEGGTLFSNVTGSKPVDLLRMISDLHDAGYNVLTFDLRNHGESATAHPVTFGQSEAKDLLGAIAYLEERDDVDSERIGALGFSMGANAILFALPQTSKIKAAIAVQPTTPMVFSKRIFANLFGLFGPLISTISGFFYQLFGGPRLAGIVPAFAASGSGNVPVLYLQGTGDEWGSVEDVSVIADMTPCTEQLLFVNSQHRFGGYNYILDHSAVATNFFQGHL